MKRQYIDSIPWQLYEQLMCNTGIEEWNADLND